MVRMDPHVWTLPVNKPTGWGPIHANLRRGITNMEAWNMAHTAVVIGVHCLESQILISDQARVNGKFRLHLGKGLSQL